jgi:hypothetical protein
MGNLIGSTIEGTVPHGNGWYYSDWFGWFCEVEDNWIYHVEHGFQFVSAPDAERLILSDPSLLNTWFWTDKDLYPVVYRIGYAPGWFWWYPETTPQARLFHFLDHGINLNHPEMMPVKPIAPSGLESRSVKHDSARLIWQDNSDNESYYEVGRYRYTSQFGYVYETVEVLPADTTEFNLSDLSASTTYYYEVRAGNYIGYSPTDVMSFTTGDGIFRVEIFATYESRLLEGGNGKIDKYDDGYLSVGISHEPHYGSSYMAAYFNEIVLLFDIQPYVTGKLVKRATLELWPKWLPEDDRITYQACALMIGWDPASITFENKPNCFTSPSAVVDAPTTKTQPVQWDVTGIGCLVKTCSYTFRDGHEYMTWFESSGSTEDEDRRPKLVLEFY